MTTATIADNTRRGLTNSSGSTTNPHETGAEEMSPVQALDLWEFSTSHYNGEIFDGLHVSCDSNGDASALLQSLENCCCCQSRKNVKSCG
ncbi:hypothetical protein SOVF_145070 [Spinacia oleracea]|nr:hypothetical protein SOVF_145070 [Spinacia oleracea]